MKSRFHEAADAELTEAVAYYDGKAPGLGDRFLAEVRSATRYIERYPEIAPVIERDVRAKSLTRFPYTFDVRRPTARAHRRPTSSTSPSAIQTSR